MIRKKLEEKILKKVYRFEAKRTLSEISLKSIAFIFLGLAIFIFGSILYEILKEQKTFDLFEIFSEDFEVIKKYFFDNVSLIFFEMPKALLIIIFFLISFFIFLLLTMIKNFKKIKNRVKSLLKYFKI